MVPYHRRAANALARPIITGRFVYLAGLDGRLCALAKERGEKRATLDLGEPILSTARIDASSLLLATRRGQILRVETRGLG